MNEVVLHGLYGKIIPRYILPFDYTSLQDGDMIENSSETRALIYRPDLEGYHLVTDDPMSVYVGDEHLSESWKKL